MHQVNHRTPLQKRAMNAVLWTTQVLWEAFFSITGFGKVLCYKRALWDQALPEVTWFSAVPQDLFIFIGVYEFLGGVMVLAAVFHIVRGEYSFLPINLLPGGRFSACWSSSILPRSGTS